MPNKDPKQEVIQKLSRFLTPSSKPATVGKEGTSITTTQEGFHFLREKSSPAIPGRMMLAVTNEIRAPGQLLICYLEQNEQGEWRYSGGASSSLGGVSDHPRVNLGGGGWPKHFHAGGYVVTSGVAVAEVRLLAANGTIVGDNVTDGIVLFFTDQPVEIPLYAELYDGAGKLVGKQNVFG